MNIYKEMMKENSYSLLNDKEEALLDMSNLLSEMITELTNTKYRVERFIDSDDTIPANHNLSLKNNSDFYTNYEKYHQLILENL